jgi:hypothetical protein
MEKTMKRIAAWSALLIALAQGQAGYASQFTDLWWKPDESGWGVSVVQQQETAFAIVFAYGPDGKPVWYVASDARATVYAGSLPIFTGTLHRARGPWHGGPFDPSQVETTPVGTLSLETLSHDRLRLHYTAEGATVVKELVRLTWRRPEVEGYFTSSFSLREASNGAPIGALIYAADTFVRIQGDAVLLRAEDEFGRTCEYSGTRAQTGKLLAASGVFACSAGRNGLQARSGTFELSDFELTAHGFTGYVRTYAPGAHEYGRFSGTLM